MDLDITALTPILGIGAPITVALIVAIKRVAERVIVIIERDAQRVVTAQEKILETTCTQSALLATLIEQHRTVQTELARIDDALDAALARRKRRGHGAH